MKKIITGNKGGIMSRKKWNELMLHLEENGFLWRDSKTKPTTGKCPSEFYRQVFIDDFDNTMSFGEIGIHSTDIFISVDDFISQK